MQQVFQCTNCGSPITYGTGYCGYCGKQFNWGIQQPIQQQMQNPLEDPLMHIIPLNPRSKEPVLLYIENKLNIPAITTNGRLSYLNGTNNLIQAVHSRIKERYPQTQFAGVQSYVMCAVTMYRTDINQAKLIFEIWGFWDHMKELDALYNAIDSLGNGKVGNSNYNQCIQYFANDPVKTWVNSLIDFLKEALNWKDYVHQSLSI
jgi:hypothetical protein